MNNEQVNFNILCNLDTTKKKYQPLLKYLNPKKREYKKRAFRNVKDWNNEVNKVEIWKKNLEEINDLYHQFKKEFELLFNEELNNLKIYHKKAYYNHAEKVLKLSQEDLAMMFENYKPSFLDFLK